MLTSRSTNFLKVEVAGNPSLQGFLLLLFVCLFVFFSFFLGGGEGGVVHCIVLYPLCRQVCKSERVSFRKQTGP